MSYGYAAVLRTIIDARGRATWKTIAKAHCAGSARGRLTAQQWLAEMAQIGLIHIGSWTVLTDCVRKTPTPCFEFGPGENAGHPGFANGRVKQPAKPRHVRSEIIGLKVALDLLRDGEYHGKQLAAELGVGAQSARKLLYALHQTRMVHISDWMLRTNGGVHCALYSFGINKADEPRPPRTSMRDHWARSNAARSARRRTLRALGLSKGTRRVSIRDLGFVHSVA